MKNKSNGRGIEFAIGILLGILVILGLLIIFIIPVKYVVTIEYIDKEPYTYTETYYENEPYTDTQCNTIRMIYDIDYKTRSTDCISEECSNYDQICDRYESICERTNKVCINKNFWGNCIEYEDRCIDYGKQCVKYVSRCAGTKCTKYKRYCKLTITNKEREGNYFSLKLQKYDYDDRESKLVRDQRLWVGALDTSTIYWDFTYSADDSYGCTYELESSPTRRECENVIKYRRVKKTRQVPGIRDVEKTKKEIRHAPLFRIWTGQVDYYIEN